MSHLSNYVSPLADDEDRKLQHSSLRRAVAIYVAMTALPLHPWGRLSPISALNNGFRFLFIHPLTVFLTPLFSLTVTWLALIIIIAVGHRKKAVTEITKALVDKQLFERVRCVGNSNHSCSRVH